MGPSLSKSKLFYYNSLIIVNKFIDPALLLVYSILLLREIISVCLFLLLEHMMDIGVGFSKEKDPVLAAKEATLQARNAIQADKFDLAIVFSSVDLSCANLLKAVSNYLSGIPVIGSSGAAVISNQGIATHGLVVMLVHFSEGAHFNTACTKDLQTKSGLQAGEELADQLLYGFKNMRRVLSIIFSDALIQESSSLLYGLQEKFGKSFPFIGASASDNFSFSKTHLYYNREIFRDGCVGMLLGGKLNFGLGVRHGWKPIGKPHTVTAASGNVVTHIDNEPAVNLYEKYLGYNFTRLKKELKHISILYPMGIYVPGEEEYLLRNVISVESDGSLRFQGNIPEESTVRLMISTKEGCLSATQEAVDEAKRGLTSPMVETKKDGVNRFVIVFSSISRYMLLKRDARKELEIIKKGFGAETPLIGLYTYGELAPLMAINYLGQVYLHNQTITVLTIGS